MTTATKILKFEDVAEIAGLKGWQKDKYLMYMKKRWGYKEKSECFFDYALEWAYRFKSNIEYAYSDDEGRAILDKL